ncbi:MAG: flagellar biosynthetic protein FliR [Phycisphaerae bacterium]|nr:flagellar biosynthetic protein FliR [Phycisphaerae bacterium]
MSLEQALAIIPAFVLVTFRIGGMMMYAPLFGSVKIPKRVKIFFTLVLALGITAGVKNPVHLPETPWGLAIGIGGEMIFGLAMGMVISLVFIAAQWAGEIIGQQIGINAGQVMDPEYGGGSSAVADLFQMLTLIIFLAIGGHLALIRGLCASFDALPLMSVGVDRPLIELLTQFFQAAAVLAMRLASPVLVTMLVVDLGLGVIGKTMPQMNVMSVGLTMRIIVGVAVLAIGISLTTGVIEQSLRAALDILQGKWSGG